MSNLEKKMNIRLHSEPTENSLNQQLCPLVSLIPLQHFKSLWTISWQTWSTLDKLLYTLMTSWSLPTCWLNITIWFDKSSRSSANTVSFLKSQNASLQKPPLSILIISLEKDRYTWTPKRLLLLLLKSYNPFLASTTTTISLLSISAKLLNPSTISLANNPGTGPLSKIMLFLS